RGPQLLDDVEQHVATAVDDRRPAEDDDVEPRQQPARGPLASGFGGGEALGVEQGLAHQRGGDVLGGAGGRHAATSSFGGGDQAVMRVPTCSPARARVRTPGRRPLTTWTCRTWRAEAMSSRTPRSTTRSGRSAARRSATVISGISSADGSFFGLAVYSP